MAAFLILSIMAMRVIQSVFSKRTAIVMPSGVKVYVWYMAISKGFAAAFALITLILSGNFSGFNGWAVLIAACSGMFLTIASLCGIKALLGGTMTLQSVFSASGLIIPCVLGIFAFNEKLTAVHVACMGGVLVSMMLLIGASKNIMGGFSAKTLLFLIMSLVSNGMTMFCQKLFGMLFPDGNVAMFSLLTFLIPSAVLFISLIFIPNDENRTKFPKKLVHYAIYQAFAVFVIQQFVTLLTPVMHSAVLFTLVNGSATIITAIVGALMYKEKITAKSALGIAVGVGALILINAL